MEYAYVGGGFVLMVFSINMCKLQMAPSCVAVMQLASHYGVVWSMCMCEGRVALSLCTPRFLGHFLFHFQ